MVTYNTGQTDNGVAIIHEMTFVGYDSESNKLTIADPATGGYRDIDPRCIDYNHSFLFTNIFS